MDVSSSSIVENAEFAGLEAISRDMTERKLYEERLEALHKHATELSEAGSLMEIGEMTFNTTHRVLGFTHGGFAVVEGSMLQFIYNFTEEIVKTVQLPLDGPGITVRAIKTGETQLIPDIREDEDFVPGFAEGVYECLSELAVPVKVGGEAVAVLNVESTKLDAFTEEDRRLLEIFAEHVASAISRLRRVERLRASEERYRTLLEASMDAVSVIVGLEIVYVNQSYVELLGLGDPSEAIGRNALDFAAVEDRELIRRIALGRQRGEDYPTRYEFKMLRTDGIKIDVETQTSLIEYEGKPAALALIRDITERKKMEGKLIETLKDLERLNTDLERSNRDLEDYTYVVSHDLKSPLRSITSFSTFLLEDYEDKLDETGKDYLKRMKAASSRMDGLINDLLILSRVGRLYMETEPVDLNKLLDTVRTDFKIQLEERRAEILVGEMPTVETQRVWMAQLFTNLIGNGLKFNKSTVPRVEVACEERQGEYIFSVRDNGIGIESRHQEQIFKLFKRLHTTEEYPGTGAGLAICKKIVDSFGGKIWVESQSGKGSTFYFTYPNEWIIETEVSEHPPGADQMNQVQEESPTPIE